MSKKRLVTVEQFKKMAKANEDLSNSLVCKTVYANKSIDKENRTIEFTISTDAIDRDQDRISQDGWDLKNYLKNPVVLFGHDASQLPIAKSVKTYLEDGKLKSKAKFVEKEIYPFADTVFNLLNEGYLNAVSVGFASKDFSWANEEERPYGVDFKKQELMEYSVVPIPSNPEALVEAKANGIDVSPIKGWAEQVLDTQNLILPKSFLEEIRKMLNNDSQHQVSKSSMEEEEDLEKEVTEDEEDGYDKSDSTEEEDKSPDEEDEDSTKSDDDEDESKEEEDDEDENSQKSYESLEKELKNLKSEVISLQEEIRSFIKGQSNDDDELIEIDEAELKSIIVAEVSATLS